MAFPPEKPKRDTRTIPINRRTLFLAFVILMVGLVVGLIIGLILTGSSSDTTLDPTRTAIAQINLTTVAEASAYVATFGTGTQAAIVAEVTAAAQANVLLPPTDTPSAAISAQSAGCTWNPVIDSASTQLYRARLQEADIDTVALVVDAPCGLGDALDPAAIAIHLALQVSDVVDEKSLGDELARALVALIAEGNNIPAIWNITFVGDNEQRVLWSVPMEQIQAAAIGSGLQGAALIAALGGVG